MSYDDGPGSSSDDDVIPSSVNRPRPAPIDTDPPASATATPAKKTGAQLLAELRAKREAAGGGTATPLRSGTPAGSTGSALLDRLRASRGGGTPSAGGAPGTPMRVTAASIAMASAEDVWNRTLTTMRVQERKHRVQKHAEKRPDPELHLIGEIVAAEGFGEHGVSCRYEFVTVSEEETDWALLGGEAKSQTQFGYPRSAKLEAPLCHPIDLHYTTRTLEHWPRLVVQVWQIDNFNCSNLVGYGVGSIPCQSGHFKLEIPTWKPIGSTKDEVNTFFLGNSQVLASDLLVYEKAATDRCLIQTVPSGKIHLNLSVMMRNFDDFFLDTH